ncbi:golgin subfamily A member 6-like protein 22 isoform X2 [Brienomyrus brachyistius]|uniref:golgin subfamily A member 6-like protein 22 isoform X2 n=1 Tax=Brienomyrus brachyistius TaxID=42636 RepID=UPI0020B35E3D|nr:golgin subfamily A member 6-like protein 22 isoform X2 [Brienomyrus brachyistius]
MDKSNVLTFEMRSAEVSGDEACTVANRSATTNMQVLLHRFKTLYEEQLERLESQELRAGDREEVLRKKVQILRSYVNDLCDQNQILVRTVEDLETEANDKLAVLQAKIGSSDQAITLSGREDSVVILRSKQGSLHNAGMEEESKIADGDIEAGMSRAELRITRRDGRAAQNKLQEEVGNLGGETATVEEVRGQAPLKSRRRLAKEVAELTAQVQESESKVNSLDLEVCLLKSKLQEKTEQSQQLQDQIVKQQEALSRATETLRSTKKAAGSKISKRDNKLELLQKKLLDVQKQYSECNNALLLREDLLQKLKEETVQLTAQIKEQSQDISRLSGEKTKLEREMTVVMEKQRTARQEVNSRDQVILQLRTTLKVTEEKLQDAERGVQEADELAKGKSIEATLLIQQQRDLQKELGDSTAAAKGHESASAIFRQKYQAAMEKVQLQEGRMAGLEEEVCYSKVQVCQAQEKVNGLTAEILSLERRYGEKCGHAEKSAEAIDQLAEELQSTQEALKVSRDRVSECERLISWLGRRVHMQQEELLEHEKASLDLQSDSVSYRRLSHSHSDAEYGELQQQRDLLRKDLDSLQRQYMEQGKRAVRLETDFQALKTDATNLEAELRRREDENRNLEHTLQSLHLDAASAHQDHKVALARLEQEVAQLEGDLADSRRTCAQKDQALRARADLLKRCEADLIQAREAFGSKELERRALERTIADLRREAQTWEEERSQREQENLSLRAEVKQLQQHMRKLHRQHRQSVQALSDHKERTTLLEASFSAMREQLGIQTAEAVRQERGSRQARAELRSAEGRARDTAEELARLNQMVQKLQADSTSGKQLLLQAQQEILEGQHKANKEPLRVTQQPNDGESHILVPVDDPNKIQDKQGGTLESESRLEVSSASPAPGDMQREHHSREEVESLKMEQYALKEKLATVSAELETQQEATKAARMETTHLQRDCEQLATNLSIWIDKQRNASESLAGKIKEQNTLLSFISMEKDHLRETKDAMEVELEKLKATSNEKQREIERLKAVDSHSSNQQALLNQPRGHLEVDESKTVSLVTQNLSRMEDMQSKLKASMESIVLLNQQREALLSTPGTDGGPLFSPMSPAPV